MGRHFAVILIVGSLVMALGAPSLAAQTASRKMLLVEMEGSGVSDAIRLGVLDRLKAGLAKHRHFEVTTPAGASLIDEMFELECVDLDDDCLGKLANKYGATSVMVLSLDSDPSGGTLFEVRLFEKTGGGGSSTFRRMGVMDSALVGMSEDALLSLVGEVAPPPKPKKGTVKVTSGVPGASVRIGRVAAGETPFVGEVPPGTYPVIIKKEGYREFVTRVTIKAGAVTEVAGELKMIPKEPEPKAVIEPAPVPAEEDKGGRPVYKQWWFWTGIAAVVAGSIATTVLLLDQDSGPSTGDLSLSLRPWDVGADPLFNP